jgi:hypothetical protein
MSEIDLSRRGFVAGLAAFTALAPAVVKAASLMPVRAPPVILRPAIVAPRGWMVTAKWGYSPAGGRGEVHLVEINDVIVPVRKLVRGHMDAVEFRENFEAIPCMDGPPIYVTTGPRTAILKTSAAAVMSHELGTIIDFFD